MTRRRADLVISALLTLLGLAMAVRAVDYHMLVDDGGIGPGFMPFAAGLALAGFAGLVAVRTAVAARVRGDDVPQDGTQHDASEGTPQADDGSAQLGRFRVAAVLGLTFGAALLSTLVGFVLAFGALVFVLLWRIERESLRLALLVAGLAVLVSWLLFVQLLAVPLPGGLLGLLGGE